MSIIITIIVFIAILSLLIIVHEIGHFYTARKFGIHVEEFGFGLPPRMFGIRKGKTLYSLNWIPLGGFVKIKGEEGENREDTNSFGSKPIWQRGIVISAGVLMNVFLAFVLLTIGFIVGTPQLLGDEDFNNSSIRDKTVRVAGIVPGLPAAKSNIRVSDVIVSVAGMPVTDISSLESNLQGYIGKPVPIEYEHRGERVTEEITPHELESGKGVIGVELITTGIVSYPVHLAVVKGATTTVTLLWDILTAFATIIADLVRGMGVRVDLAGPVGIAVLTSEVTRLGMVYVIQFAALLSLNLAIINFIPFPALDGGRFFFLIIEKIKGKPLNSQLQAWIHSAGFVMLMVLVVIVTYRDISRFQTGFSDLWNRLLSAF